MKSALGIMVVFFVLGAPGSAHAVSASREELVQSRRWAAARLEGVGQQESVDRTLFSTDPLFSFDYGGKPASELLKAWTLKRAWRPSASESTTLGKTEHTLIWTDPNTGLQVRCRAVEYRDFPVVEWTLFLKNTGSNDTAVLSAIQPLDLLLDRPEPEPGELLLHYQRGDDCTPDSYAPRQETLAPSSEHRFAPVGGRPTNQGFPYFNLEWPGAGLIVAVGWPGQWAAQFSRDSGKRLRVQAGQELTHFKLRPGEEVRTPLIVLQFWKGDCEHAQNVWRRWMLAHNLPRTHEKLPPPIFTSCSGGFFPGLKCHEVDELRFVDAFSEAGIKLDYWWMDAGWYPCGDGWPKVGTWIPDATRFPHGLKSISEHAHGKGMGLIVWFEPERVAPGTWLYEQHPEWLLGRDGDTKLLNLGITAARQWLTDHVDTQLTEQQIDFYRQDFNMDPLLYWRAGEAPDRQGITEIRHVEGYLAYWDELRRRHPGLRIDSCASGGRRNDLETLRRAVPLLRSDYQSFQGDPAYAPGNQGHTYGLSSWLPYYGQGVYYNNRQLLYCVRSSLSPAFGFCVDVRTPGVDWAAVRLIADQWRRVAHCFLGDFYRLAPYRSENDAWIAWQFDLPESGDGMVQVFRRADSPYESARFRLHGLDADGRYALTDLDHPGRKQEFTGQELLERGLAVVLEEKPSAGIIAYTRIKAAPAQEGRFERSVAAAPTETPAGRSAPFRPKRRLLVNNDGTNLLWRDDLTPQMVQRHVAECPNAVTTYLLCPNGIQKMLFPSAHEELATRGMLPKLVAAGRDPFGEFLVGLKTRGFETFITWRMNEVHNVNVPGEPDLSRFWREHPEYRVERSAHTNDWMAQCLDYSLAPVREYNLALIFELMEKYEPDGIELDWMRFPRHLSGSGEEIWNQRRFLTEVVSRVKAKADELGKSRRRPMLVAVRVPTSPAGCHALGVDLAEWSRRSLLDFVTASPFLASDFAMPLAELRRLLGVRPVPLYAAIELGYAGKSHREETIRAAALGLWESGADGIYLFNFPCWREQQPHPFWSWVPQLGDPQRWTGRELTFPLINGHHRVSGIDLPTPLPLTIPTGASRTVVLPLPRAAVSAEHRPLSAHLKVEDATNLAIRINGVAVDDKQALPAEALRAGDNQVELANRGAASATVTVAELALEYALVPPLALTNAACTLYVATGGSDRNRGSAAEPFRTLAKARDAARAVRLSNSPAGRPITVVLRGGRHELHQPLILDARDSDTIFRAFPGERPVISGGRLVTGWKRDDQDRWKTTAELSPFRQLYVNGRRAVRARGDCPKDVVRYGTSDFIDGETGFLFPDGAMADWRNPGEVELGFFNSWGHMICPVKGITRNAGGHAVVRMRQPAFFLASRKEGVQAKLPAYLENALELLDAPGEWYYDRLAHTLYYRPRPGEDMTQATVIAPQLESLVQVKGTLDRPVRGVVFEGIAFAEATWLGPSANGHLDVQANFTTDAAHLFSRDGWVVKQQNEYLKSPANVCLRAAESCRFERCTFTRLGGAGLDLEHGARDNAVNGCHFFDISGSAIQVGDVQAADHHPDDLRLIVRGNQVTNCRIHDIGADFEDSVGVFAGYTDGTVIAHNEIHDLPYSGISVGWGWGEEDAGGGAYPVVPFRYATPTPAGANRIENNHIHHVMRRRDDGGAIYTLGNQPGTVLRENHIHDCGPGRPGGIYLDEGSGFIEITRNLVYRVATPMNYNNRAQDRITTCFEHDNLFGTLQGTADLSDRIVQKAGPEPTYGVPD